MTCYNFSYNAWHQWFYNRPSVFLPNAPPKPKTPAADVLSQINVASKFVAANGAFSERNLLGKSRSSRITTQSYSSEHNRGRLNFLYPNSEFLVYYHSKLRFFQARLNPRVMPCVYSKYHKQYEVEFPVQTFKPAPPPPETKQDSKLASFEQPATSSSVISNIPAAPTPPIKTSAFPIDDSAPSDPDEETRRKRK